MSIATRHVLTWLLTSNLLIGPAAADIYKCRLPDGRTEISNSPCPGGSGTVSSRPDDTVPEASRRQAERDVERMRSFVEKREAAQRAEAAEERQAQIAAQQRAASTPSRSYGDPDACLRELNTQALEAGHRAVLEAQCRSLVRPPAPVVQQPVYIPVWVGPPPRHHVPPAHPVPKPAPGTATTLPCPPNSKHCRH